MTELLKERADFVAPMKPLSHVAGKTKKRSDRGVRTQSALSQAISRSPLLTAEEECTLGKRARKGDREAINKLVSSNLRLVIKIARQGYVRPGFYPLSDAIQDGTIGLIRAAEKYDPSQGSRFSTYAVMWISQALYRGSIRSGSMIWIPFRQVSAIRKLSQEHNDGGFNDSASLSSPEDGGYQDSTDSLCKESIVNLSLLSSVQSLDAPQSSSSYDALAPTQETIFDRSTHADPYEHVCHQEMIEKTSEAFKGLPEKERKALTYRYLSAQDGTSKMSYRQISEEMALSPESARRYVSRGLRTVSARYPELRSFLRAG